MKEHRSTEIDTFFSFTPWMQHQKGCFSFPLTSVVNVTTSITKLQHLKAPRRSYQGNGVKYEKKETPENNVNKKWL